MSLVAQAKKLIEYSMMDEKFRVELMQNPQLAFDKWGIGLNAEATRRFWDRREDAYFELLNGINLLNDQEIALYKVFQSVNRVLQFYYDRSRFDSADADFKQWRNRMMHRNYFMTGEARAKMALLLPFGIELTDGCTGGCWFCGVGADKFRGFYETSAQNMQLFREILLYFKTFLHENAQNGFLYYATDPLDHPDYHLFSEIFYQVNDAHPAMTTALADKYPDRVLKIKKMINNKPGPGLRFSVYSLRQLDKIFQLFDNEELIDISFAQLAHGSMLAVANSGHARRRFLENQARGHHEKEKSEAIDLTHETISCVYGFVLNLVKRTISLVVPINASDKFPDGTEFIAQSRYENFQDIKDFIDNIRKTTMRDKLLPNDELQMQANIEIIEENAIVKAVSPYHILRIFYATMPNQEIINFINRFKTLTKFSEIPLEMHELTHFLWQKGVIEINYCK